jgi:hypothetical protein
VLELLAAYRTFEAFPELHARLRETEFRVPDIVVERKPVVNEEYPALAGIPLHRNSVPGPDPPATVR